MKAVLTPMRNHKPGNPIVFDHLDRTVNGTSVGNHPDHNSDSGVRQYNRIPLFCCEQNGICFSHVFISI